MSSLTCREVILNYLSDYLDEALSPEVVADLEGHLASCPPCMAYLNTYRTTRDLTARGAAVSMPDEMQALLRQFLLNQLAQGQP